MPAPITPTDLRAEITELAEQISTCGVTAQAMDIAPPFLAEIAPWSNYRPHMAAQYVAALQH